MAIRPSYKFRRSFLLTPEEQDILFRIFKPNCRCLASGIVQVYRTEEPHHDDWFKLDTGVLCLVKDFNMRSYYFRLYCLEREQAVWEHEIYKEIEYKMPRPFLHTFEAEEYMTAFNFACQDECKYFYDKFNKKILRNGNSTSKRRNDQYKMSDKTDEDIYECSTVFQYPEKETLKQPQESQNDINETSTVGKKWWLFGKSKSDKKTNKNGKSSETGDDAGVEAEDSSSVSQRHQSVDNIYITKSEKPYSTRPLPQVPLEAVSTSDLYSNQVFEDNVDASSPPVPAIPVEDIPPGVSEGLLKKDWTDLVVDERTKKKPKKKNKEDKKATKECCDEDYLLPVSMDNCNEPNKLGYWPEENLPEEIIEQGSSTLVKPQKSTSKISISEPTEFIHFAGSTRWKDQKLIIAASSTARRPLPPTPALKDPQQKESEKHNRTNIPEDSNTKEAQQGRRKSGWIFSINKKDKKTEKNDKSSLVNSTEEIAPEEAPVVEPIKPLSVEGIPTEVSEMMLKKNWVELMLSIKKKKKKEEKKQKKSATKEIGYDDDYLPPLSMEDDENIYETHSTKSWPNENLPPEVIEQESPNAVKTKTLARKLSKTSIGTPTEFIHFASFTQTKVLENSEKNHVAQRPLPPIPITAESTKQKGKWKNSEKMIQKLIPTDNSDTEDTWKPKNRMSSKKSKKKPSFSEDVDEADSEYQNLKTEIKPKPLKRTPPTIIPTEDSDMENEEVQPSGMMKLKPPPRKPPGMSNKPSAMSRTKILPKPLKMQDRHVNLSKESNISAPPPPPPPPTLTTYDLISIGSDDSASNKAALGIFKHTSNRTDLLSEIRKSQSLRPSKPNITEKRDVTDNSGTIAHVLANKVKSIRNVVYSSNSSDESSSGDEW